LVDHPLSITTEQIGICVDQCQQNRSYNTELDLVVGSQNDNTNIKKRPRLAGDSGTYDCGQTSVSNKLTQEEILNKFKDVISVVPTYSASEFRSLLVEKQKLFSAQATDDVSSEGAIDADSHRLHDIINAFCHPEVISKIKDRILMHI
jgi:hypothetical protein